jgi:thymidine kinase
MPLSDKIEKLSALCSNCRDGTPAIFSHRVTNEQQQISIGSDNYIPLCRSCYQNKNQQKSF